MLNLNPLSLFYRKILKVLVVGQGFICVTKFLIFGPITGVFSLINLWVIYSAYASMHFCCLVIFIIMCCCDLFFLNADWRSLKKREGEEDVGFIKFMFIVMGAYYVLSIFICYKIYLVYKEMFMQQVGSSDDF